MTTINTFASILALIIAVVGHEIMHGAVAHILGDDTAKRAGRLSPNPLKHIDIIGTIIVPLLLYITKAGFLFGWAKPVPVNIAKIIFKNGEIGGIAVSLAGIIYNFLCAFLSAFVLHYLSVGSGSGILSIFFYLFFINMVLINLILAIFNLLPIPPLDGGHTVWHILRAVGLSRIALGYIKIQNIGFLVVVAILAIDGFSNIVFFPYFLLANELSRFLL